MFGASTSSFQVEGGTGEDDRGISNYDCFPKKPGITDFSVASDHYHRMEEDVALMAEIGLDCYRFSVSWVRIMPDGKTVNEKGLRFYDRLIDALTAARITPILTIYHFEYPQALLNRYGGWLSRESIDDYLALARLLFIRYGNRVKHWVSINEQDHLLKIPERMGFPAELNGVEYERKAQLANYHLCLAAALVNRLCHELVPGAFIGPAANPLQAIPASSKPEDYLAAMAYNELECNYILELNCRGRYVPLYWKYLCDRGIQPDTREEDMKILRDNPPNFIGINYYTSITVEASEAGKIQCRGRGIMLQELPGVYRTRENKKLPVSEWGWPIRPEGIKIAIMELYHRYQLPILVTENGLGNRDRPENGAIHDDYRIDYLRAHLHEIKECIDLGYPVLGWCPWSFIDLVSGREGMGKRYGFVYVNRDNNDLKDLGRYKKDSFYWYQRVIAERGRYI